MDGLLSLAGLLLLMAVLYGVGRAFGFIPRFDFHPMRRKRR